MFNMDTRQAFTGESFTNYENILYLCSFFENLGMLSVIARFLWLPNSLYFNISALDQTKMILKVL